MGFDNKSMNSKNNIARNGHENESNKDKKKLAKMSSKIIAYILLPTLIMVSFSVFSYIKVRNAVVREYEHNTVTRLEAIDEYLSLSLSYVSELSNSLNIDKIVNRYYVNRDDEKETDRLINDRNLIISLLSLHKSSNPFVKDIHIVGSLGRGISTSEPYSSYIYVYEEIAKSKVEEYMKSNNLNQVWVTSYAFLSDQSNFDKDSSAISLITRMKEDKGYIIIDIDGNKIYDTLKNYDLGQGSIVAFITREGQEIISGNEDSIAKAQGDFANKSYIKEALASDQDYGQKNLIFDGKPHLFTYNRLADQASIIFTLIPESTILSEATSYRTSLIIIAGIALILALIIGDAYAIKLTKTFLDITSRASRLSSTADDLEVTYGGLFEQVKELTKRSGEIKESIAKEVSETELSLGQINLLSGQIDNLYNNLNNLNKYVASTLLQVEDNIVANHDIETKSKVTLEAADTIVNEISSLQEKLTSLDNSVDIINEIAKQSKLLSLNVSIEATRAGESRRSFEILASKIRKLSIRSKDAAKRIKDMVVQINKGTQETYNIAKRLNLIVASQDDSIRETINIFNEIHIKILDLHGSLNRIVTSIYEVDAIKADTIYSLENVSKLADKINFDEKELKARVEELQGLIDSLNKSVVDLAQEGRALKEAVLFFIHDE